MATFKMATHFTLRFVNAYGPFSSRCLSNGLLFCVAIAEIKGEESHDPFQVTATLYHLPLKPLSSIEFRVKTNKIDWVWRY